MKAEAQRVGDGLGSGAREGLENEIAGRLIGNLQGGELDIAEPENEVGGEASWKIKGLAGNYGMVARK